MVFWVSILSVMTAFFTRREKTSWFTDHGWCSVAVPLVFFGARCPAMTKGRIFPMCGLVSSVSQRRYTIGGRSNLSKAAVSKRVRCHGEMFSPGAYCLHILYDAWMILRSHWRRLRFVVLFSLYVYEDLYYTTNPAERLASIFSGMFA